MQKLIDGLCLLNSFDKDLVVEAECGAILIEKPEGLQEYDIKWLEKNGFILKYDTFHYYL